MKLIHFFEKIDDMDMGDVIKDFYKSDAKQFKGKSKKKRRQMAIAAKLSADEGVEESGCLGKQIKKGKSKKSESVEESFKHYKVKHKKSGKEYKVTAMHDKSAKEKARAKHGGTASRYTGTSTSDFEIVESYIKEDIDLNDGMIGSPDSFYDEEERKEAYDDLKDALEMFAKGHEQESVMQGVCPNCAGTGYQDAEYPEYDDDGEEIEGSAFECDGYGMFGCDEGEMVGASWVDIIKHDERRAERQKAKDNYPGDEAVIDQIARAVKQLDDPRQMFQYMKADYPFMGMAQRSDLISKGMKKAGLTSESLNEGEERQMIEIATIQWLVNYFEDRVQDMESMEELGTAIYDELSYLDLEDIGLEDAETGGQPIRDYFNGRVIDVLDSGSVIDDVLQKLDLAELEARDPVFPEIYKDEPFKKKQEEGTIDQTFATDTIDKHDKKADKKHKDKDKDKLDEEPLEYLSGIYRGTSNEAQYKQQLQWQLSIQLGIQDGYGKRTIEDMETELAQSNPIAYNDYKIYKAVQKDKYRISEANYAGDEQAGIAQMVKDRRGKEFKFDKASKKFKSVDGEEAALDTPLGKELKQQREKQLRKSQPGNRRQRTDYRSSFFGNLFNDVNEDAESDASEVAVAKMIAKALGDENRWTEMSAAELYAELESDDTDRADVVKDVAKMVYGVELTENIVYEEITLEDDQDFTEEFGILGYSIDEENTFEAEYRGRKVKLNKPMRGDVKKFKVYVKDPKTGNVKKVNFGHGGTSAKRPTMRIRKSNPKARKSFRARHNCDNPGPKTKARYWSCRKW